MYGCPFCECVLSLWRKGETEGWRKELHFSGKVDLRLIIYLFIILSEFGVKMVQVIPLAEGREDGH